MRKIITLLYIILCSTLSTLAQPSTGTVSSLVAAENYFAALAKEKNTKQAFLAVSTDQTLVFRPNPVSAISFFKEQPTNTGILSWQPSFAKISRSGDWGFTTGPYTYKADTLSAKSFYGQYVSVWKTNKKGIWKLALDAGISHPQPQNKPELIFTDPEKTRFFNQKSESRLKQREDMILITDRLFSTTLKKYDILAYNAFMSDDAHLLFPGFEPIIGKQNIIDFLRSKALKITTEPVKADRALGSDLAYSYGSASIVKDKQTSIYNYIRLWEIQNDHKWNVILEIFIP